MKNLLYVLVFTICFSSIMAQGIIDRNYSQYVDQEDVTHVFVSGKLFDFASIIIGSVEDQDVKEMSEFASKIESFSLIKVPNAVNAQAEFKKGMADIQNDYDELMRVRDEGQRFAVFVDEEDDVVYEVVGLGIVDGEFLAISLIGEMDLNKIAEFVSKVDNDAFEPLKRISEFKPNEMKVYPNPTNVNSEINITVPEGMIGGAATIYDMNGKKIRSIDVKSSTETMDTRNLTPGNYFVELTKDSVSMKKQVIIVQ